LTSGVLIENTPCWKGISRFIRDTWSMYPSFGGVAQNVQSAKRSDKKHVVARMPLLLATILQRSVDVVARTIHGTFYAVMDTKGGASVACDGSSCDGSSCDGSPCNRCASSSAVRAGRRCCCESASFSAPCKRCTHVLTFDWRMGTMGPCITCVGFCFKEVNIKSNVSSVVGSGEFA
jgi:hypothetical protein